MMVTGLVFIRKEKKGVSNVRREMIKLIVRCLHSRVIFQASYLLLAKFM